MAGRVILLMLVAAALPLQGSTVYWAAASNVDYTVLGSWLTLTGYTIDLKTGAPEDGSDPAMVANVHAFQAFVPADSKAQGENLLAMREGAGANTALYVGPEYAEDREPKLVAENGAAPNAGTLSIASPDAVYSGGNGCVGQTWFGPLTGSSARGTLGDLHAGRSEPPDALIAASADDSPAPSGEIKSADQK